MSCAYPEGRFPAPCRARPGGVRRQPAQVVGDATAEPSGPAVHWQRHMPNDRPVWPARLRRLPTGATTLVVHACVRRAIIAARSLPVIAATTAVSSSTGVGALMRGLLLRSAGVHGPPVLVQGVPA